jgi:two-component system nitrogen regulation response regulator GlnG
MENTGDGQDGDTRLTTTNDGDTAPSSTIVPALTILAHPDVGRIGERIALPVLALGHEVQLSRLDPIFRPPDQATEGQPLAERSISRQPIRLRGGDEPDALLLDARETRTRIVVEGEPVDETYTLSAADVLRGAVLQVGRHVVLLLHRVTLPFPEAAARFGLVGESDAVLRLCQELERLASTHGPVLLRGESGTGKELAARALHDGGPRRVGPFVAVNMATLSPSLAAAELFGAERGAYTGADRKKKGFFQSAEGGTLFLDEIAETPVEVQAMLLRALENREVVPVGSTEARAVDVRVIAATDARLEEAMAEGRFRTPLYHRLAGYTVELPPLRERRDDVGRLLHFFLEKGSWPSAEVVARLARYDWPGNVRELRNVARRLALDGRDVPLEKLLTQGVKPNATEPEPSGTESAAARAAVPILRRLRRRPAEVSEEELLAALETHGYRMRESAEALDLSRVNFYRRLDQSPNVRKAADLERGEIEEALKAAGGDIKAAALALCVSGQGLKRRMTALGPPWPSAFAGS